MALHLNFLSTPMSFFRAKAPHQGYDRVIVDSLRRRAWALTLLLLLLLSSATTARAATPIRLRVLSWNVWGLPAVSPDLEERIRALPDAMAALAPDVILLQEVWEAEDGVSLARDLRRRGYPHSEHLVRTPAGKTGLFIASRRKLSLAEFRPFTIGRMPHSLWHLDWMASKGIARWVVQTELGEVALAGTHLQAQYETDTYDAERLSQAVEVGLMNRREPDRPLILAGDFNSDPGDLPRTTVSDLARVTDVGKSQSPDTVFVSNGRALSIRVLDVREVLTEPYTLANGEREPLSDHAAVLVDVELSSCADCRSPQSANVDTRRAALSTLRSAVATTPWGVTLALLAAALILAVAALWRRLARRLGLSPRRAMAFQLAGFTLLAVGFTWSSYVGAIYYPARSAALRSVVAELERSR
jgi:endonuclease/exonuclease/phosphatase family metal-dependent hydrolase